jgi:HPt (histidine-containing phosphotransfer) domain-containing protein
MDDYLSKPIVPEDLYAAVEAVPPAAVPSDEHPAADVEIFDPATLRERLQNDEELMLTVIQMFLSECPARVSAVTGAAASGDSSALRSAAHALKGAAGTLSARALADASHEAETLATGAHANQASRAAERVEREAQRLSEVLAAFLNRRTAGVA